ncbi:hypothetical protein DSY14_14975 [Nocardiopsis sp. MG754419]|nr:hypothetical protein [Nocardiopsis sp. MG754419]
MPPERVADILATIPEGAVRYRTATPDTLLDLIMVVAYRPTAYERLTLPHHQILRAAVGAAEEERDLRPAPGDHTEPRTRGTLLLDTVVLGPVDHETLVGRVGADRPGLARMRAEECVADLVDLAILWPDGQGGYHLPDDAGHQFGVHHYPRPVREALEEEYDLPTLRRMALTLGLDPTAERATLITGLIRVLTDRRRVHHLVRHAPHDVGHRILECGFHAEEVEVAGLGGADRFHMPVDGSGDDELDWLLDRGLLMPTADGGEGVGRSRTFAVPREVALAIRRSRPYPFDPAPQQIMGPPVEEMLPGRGPDAVEEASRAALTTLAGIDTRLTAALAERPGRLRADGHLGVPSRRRLTRQAGGNEDLARTWVEVGAQTGLLVADSGQVTLSAQGRRTWSASAPEARLATLLEGWARRAEDARWWPTDDEPVAAGALDQGADARTRWAVVCALRDVPRGVTLGISGARAARELAEEGTRVAGTRWLLSAAYWYQPMTATDPDHEFRVMRAYHEAEVLGVVYAGAATRVGWALSERVRSAPQVQEGAGEVVSAAVRETLGLGAPTSEETWGGPVALAGPWRIRHRELAGWARRLFGRPWA